MVRHCNMLHQFPSYSDLIISAVNSKDLQNLAAADLLNDVEIKSVIKVSVLV